MRSGFGQVGLAGSVILGLCVAAALYLISGPLAMLAAAALRGPQDALPFEPGTHWTFANLRAIFFDRALLGVVPNTLVFVVGSVALAFTVGFVLAFLVERTDLPGRLAIFTAVLFPLLVPGVVLAVAWIFLLGPHAGWLNLVLRAALDLSGDGPFNIFSMSGLILAQGAALVPFMFLLLTAVLRAMNPALEEAGFTAGASPLSTFFRVSLPVLRPGLLAPLILAALISLEQFEMPLIIGLPARINVFSTRIYYELNPDTDLPAYGRAAAMALPFLAAAFLLLLIYNALVKEAERFATVTGKAYRPRRFELGAWTAPALCFVALYVGFAVLLPALVLVWTSFFGLERPSIAVLLHPNLSAYTNLFADPVFWLALRNTFIVAGASALIVTLLGAALAWIILRTRWPGRFFLDVVSFASIGIPSVIAGLAALLLYLSLPLGIYGTVWVLILAYSYRLAVATRLVRAALTQIHRELEEAAFAAGGSWLATMRHVLVPLLAPAALASFLLLFIVGFREFTLPLILQSPDNPVLSVMMWNLFTANRSAAAAAVGTLIAACVVPVIFIARRMLLRGLD
jgi:iron(III) transport system permease protein